MSHSRATYKKGWRASRYAERREKGLCTKCGKPSKGYRCKTCKKEQRKTTAAYRLKLKLEVFAAYGGARCACAHCPEHRRPHLSMLTLNHINGGGNTHRRNLGGVKPRSGIGGYNNSTSVYLWAKRNKYPPIFNVLCWNCQWGVYLNKGRCPHEVERRK